MCNLECTQSTVSFNQRNLFFDIRSKEKFLWIERNFLIRAIFLWFEETFLEVILRVYLIRKSYFKTNVLVCLRKQPPFLNFFLSFLLLSVYNIACLFLDILRVQFFAIKEFFCIFGQRENSFHSNEMEMKNENEMKTIDLERRLLNMVGNFSNRWIKVKHFE